MLVRAAGEFEIGGGLVTDFEAFEFDDADVLRAALPDLTLLKFERHGILEVCLSRGSSRERQMKTTSSWT